MNKGDRIKEFLLQERNRLSTVDQLLVQLIEDRALERDRQVNLDLLRELVIKYANAERKLSELNQLKNKFLGMAAHDLRNPLVSIRGFSEILLEDESLSLDSDQREMLTMIHQASQDMLTLVNDLLDVAVIESGKLSLQLKKGSLSRLVDERVRLCRVPADRKGIKLSAHFEELPDMSFDANRLGQVIDNLIGNAIKFSPSDTSVTITVDRENRMARVRVQDQGPGLSEADQAKLFGEFQRLSARPTGGEKSTGLGLAIVKKIVEAHGGTVGVISTLGSGTTFYFRLPLEVIHG